MKFNFDATVTTLKDDCQQYFSNGYLSNIDFFHPYINENTEDESEIRAFFFVKRHQFSNSQKFYLYNIEANPNYNFRVSVNLNNQTTPASNPLRDGEKSQGNDDPRSYFENHEMISYQSKSGIIYLDPSYGIPNSGTVFTNESSYEDIAIEGFGTMLFYETSPLVGYNLIWLNEMNNANKQMNFD